MEKETTKKEILGAADKVKEKIGDLPKSRIEILMEILCKKKIITKKDMRNILQM